jgi:hypothetical protein
MKKSFLFTVGRTPWSAAGPLAGFPEFCRIFAAAGERPARGPAADQGVRPTGGPAPSRDL